MKKTLLTTALFVTLSQFGWAQTSFDKAKLDNYFQNLETNNKFMGSIAVSQDGKVIYTKSIGFADVENNQKANENTKYRIGSISKTFTTVMVMKAVEDKKLDLNQTIEKFFPTVPNANKITIKQLLGHRSGIHNFTNDDEYMTWYTQPKTEKEMVEIITKIGSDFEPDSKADYSNSNFVLLTYILEKTYKQSFADLLDKQIIKPLELKNTKFGGKINTTNNESKSYSYKGSWKEEPETDMSIPLGAGGIISSPSDLTKFSDALFGGKLLRAESLELMKTVVDGYGLGLFKIPFYDKTGFGHTGGIDNFTSMFSYFPDGNVSYAMTSNGTNYSNNNISIAVLSAVYGKDYEIPEFSNYEVTAEELEQYLGVYSSITIPIKITITQDGNTLLAQATGQSAFPLEASAKDEFKFDLANIVIEFIPTEKKLILKQSGMELTFLKP
jgi:D-alanyl-D-alanine carboxypeptidase